MRRSATRHPRETEGRWKAQTGFKSAAGQPAIRDADGRREMQIRFKARSV